MQTLLTVTTVSILAILLVSLLRKPLRSAVGARAAYWLWLIVPASAVAVMAPAPSPMQLAASKALPQIMGAPWSEAVWSAASVHSSSEISSLMLTIWLSGACLAFASLFLHQRTFIRSLGPVIETSDRIFRSRCIVSPMLVGAWQPRILVPFDFEARYTPEERELMLAHERVHLSRCDAQINALAAGWQCLFWFNPFVYWAVTQLRFDQELACDAVVLAHWETARRRYADALLKTQLAADHARRAPIGCHWESDHPLKERITMLKHRLPGSARRLTGITIAIALTLAGSYTAWAAQPQVQAPITGAAIAVNMKWQVNGVDVLLPSGASSIDILARSGKEFVRTVSSAPDQISETRCSPSLPNDDKPSPVWETAKASGLKSTQGMILFECKLSSNGKVFSTPAIIVGEGKVGVIEAADQSTHARFRLELNASTLSSRINKAH
jgi:beta-lactamase regulating signal transducer with metallopeptidase domain